MRNFKFILWVFTGLVVSFSGLSFAEEKVLKLGEVVVTATKQERLAKDTPAAVTVITSEDIEKSGASTIAEALKGIPGVAVYDKYGSGVGADIVLRGHYHAGHSYGYTLVLVDGMPQVTPDSGKVYWDLIPLSNVERIEVVMGPGSALWGGNAVGGTVNIITKKPSKEPVAQVTTKFGEYGMKHYSFYGSIMGKEDWMKDLGLAVSFESKEADGWRANSDYDIKNYWAKISKDIKDWNANLSLTLSRSDKFIHYPGKISQDMWDSGDLTSLFKDYYKYNYSDTEQYYERLVFEKTFEKSSLKVNLYNYHKHYDLFYAFSFGGLCYDVDADTNIAGGLQYEFGFGSHSFILGGDFEFQKIKQNSCHSDADYNCDWTNPYRKTKTDIIKYSFYLQDSWKIFKSLEAILGLRWDKAEFDNKGDWWNWSGTTKTDASGTNSMDGWSPKASLLYKVNNNWNLYGSIGRAFRIPNPHDMFVGSSANPNLKPEKATTYEIGMKYSSSNFAGSLAFYITKTEDLIVKSSPEWNAPFENIGKTKHKGVEVNFAYRIMDGLVVNLNADYTQAKVKKNPADTSVEGKYIDRIPKYKVSFGLDYTHPSGFFASFVGRRIGKWYMDDMNERTYSGYFVADLKLGYRKDFGKSEVEVSVGCNNIFDKKYAAMAYTSYGKNYYYPGMPRYFFGEMKIKF